METAYIVRYDKSNNMHTNYSSQLTTATESTIATPVNGKVIDRALITLKLLKFTCDHKRSNMRFR